MPYSRQHKDQTRAKITEAARILFNQQGFSGVTIDAVMQAAGLTRGGFYNHFPSKEALYSEAVASFLHGRGAQWRAEAGVDPDNPKPDQAQRMLKSYLSAEHLEDTDGQCPMIALASDTARHGDQVSQAYQRLLEGMVSVFEQGILAASASRSAATAKAKPRSKRAVQRSRDQALALAALSIGGMVVARALPQGPLVDEVRTASYQMAQTIAEQGVGSE